MFSEVRYVLKTYLMTRSQPTNIYLTIIDLTFYPNPQPQSKSILLWKVRNIMVQIRLEPRLFAVRHQTAFEPEIATDHPKGACRCQKVWDTALAVVMTSFVDAITTQTLHTIICRVHVDSIYRNLSTANARFQKINIDRVQLFKFNGPHGECLIHFHGEQAQLRSLVFEAKRREH